MRASAGTGTGAGSALVGVAWVEPLPLADVGAARSLGSQHGGRGRSRILHLAGGSKGEEMP